jgi:hypothetical protein
MTPKPEFPPCSGRSVEGTYLLATRCPVFRRRESNPGFRTELENWAGDAKAQVDDPREHRPGAHC